MVTYLWDIGKKHSPKCDTTKHSPRCETAECGIPSQAILFTTSNVVEINKISYKLKSVPMFLKIKMDSNDNDGHVYSSKWVKY